MSPVGPDGPATIVVCGGVVSGGAAVVTVKLRLAGLWSVLLAASMARTSSVCGPAASVAVVWEEEQEANAAVSTRHSKVEPGSLEVKAKVGVSR